MTNEWSKRLRLTYRAFVREHRDIQGVVDDIILKIQEHSSTPSVSNIRSIQVPIRAEDITKMREHGFVLTTGAQDDVAPLMALIREWVLVLPVPTQVIDHRLWVDSLLQSVGHVFTNVSIVDDMFTDVGPQ